jgi:hypothetical protein
MTMLEKIVNDRAWRGCKVRRIKHDGQPAYKLTHPGGAEAIVFKEPGDMDSRKWKAWAWKRTCERRGYRS